MRTCHRTNCNCSSIPVSIVLMIGNYVVASPPSISPSLSIQLVQIFIYCIKNKLMTILPSRDDIPSSDCLFTHPSALSAKNRKTISPYYYTILSNKYVVNDDDTHWTGWITKLLSTQLEKGSSTRGRERRGNRMRNWDLMGWAGTHEFIIKSRFSFWKALRNT